MYSGVQHIVRDDKVEEQEKKHLLGYYDYTVILTYCGMLFAFWGIISSINGQFKTAVICLMLAGLCDMFDGAVASTKTRTKSEKRFGIQIDSLSDLISFGVLPAVFGYMFSGGAAFAAASSSLYLLFALIRLSYFNVLEEERQDSTSERRTEYLGVPVTTVAVLLPLVYILYSVGAVSGMFLLPAALLVLGNFFVIAVKVKKPHKAGKAVMVVFGLIELASVIIL